MIFCVCIVSAGGAYAHVTVGLCLLWRVRTSRKIRQPVRENKKKDETAVCGQRSHPIVSLFCLSFYPRWNLMYLVALTFFKLLILRIFFPACLNLLLSACLMTIVCFLAPAAFALA